MDTKKALKLAKSLKDKHGLHNWRVNLTGAKFYFGVCRYSEKRLSLSKHLVKLNTEHQVRNTILHEIAHALTPKNGHGKKWCETFTSIGGDGNQCYDSQNVKLPPANYTGVCPNGHINTRYRMSKRASTIACTKCCKNYSNGKYDPKFMFNWKRNKNSL